MLFIDDYEIYKLTLPLGRVIGDNNCSYDTLDLLSIALKTNQGHIGWGYAESVWKGNFQREAWYVKELLPLHEIENIFTSTWHKQLIGVDFHGLEDVRVQYKSGYAQLDAAIRLALWDLKAQERNLPLYRLLNPTQYKSAALAYGSILDFPLSDDDAVHLTKGFLNDGFSIIKVKVGAPNEERDINRLQLIQSVAGTSISITADANESMNWQTALKRIEAFEKNGIHLEYLEDPLDHKDVAGFKELTKRSPIPIIGHDYINQYEDLKILLSEGGLNGIRTGKDIDYIISCINLAKEFDVPVYLGNSMFEINAHAGLAFDQVNRTEYSNLETNCIIQNPIVFKDGQIQQPLGVGHGLYPRESVLTQSRKDYPTSKS